MGVLHCVRVGVRPYVPFWLGLECLAAFVRAEIIRSALIDRRFCPTGAHAHPAYGIECRVWRKRGRATQVPASAAQAEAHHQENETGDRYEKEQRSHSLSSFIHRCLKIIDARHIESLHSSADILKKRSDSLRLRNAYIATARGLRSQSN